MKTGLAIFLVASALSMLQGCSSWTRQNPTLGSREPASNSLFGPSPDRPWELIDPLGQTILPNIFYSDEADNEQLMPLTMPNHRLQISRLVYPTLGNPRLFIRTRENDSGVFVLRLEKDLYTQAGFQEADLIPGTHLIRTTLPSDSPNEIAFYLIKRERKTARDHDLGELAAKKAPFDADPDLSQAIRITPTLMAVHEEFPGMPKVLQERKTLQVSFSKSELAAIPAGLYDVSFTLTRKSNHALVAYKGFKVYETQFNAFRIFNEGPEANGNKYSVINVSDTQVSLGLTLRSKTVNKLAAFVNFVNLSKDPKIQSAPFILFNGDLHNSGSPLMERPKTVLNNYNRESWTIMSILKELNFPIFLIMGNHDGYCNLGFAGGKGFWQTQDGKNETLIDVVMDRPDEYRTWPGFTVGGAAQLLRQEQADESGDHFNIFSGRFIRHEGVKGWAAWQEMALGDRNVVTYDGVYQWQKTYGPQYYSFVFGQNHYVNADSFELRQHRRNGWGLYSSNYGGNISAYQMDWIGAEFARSKTASQDLIFLAHHDPRGGHKGLDYPYYFKQLDFAGVGANFWGYVKSEVLKNTICDGPLRVTMDGKKRELFCTHDGLQEWMRSDKEFDCPDEIKLPNGTCDPCKFSREERPYYSGYNLVHLWAKTDNLRTVILGHTHFHSLEVLRTDTPESAEIIPRHVVLDFTAQERMAGIDPARQAAADREKKKAAAQVACPEYKENFEAYRHLDNGRYELNFDKAGFKFKSQLEGRNRELTIIRVAPSADITGQHIVTRPDETDSETHNQVSLSDQHMHGFSVLDIFPKADSRDYDLPQVNAMAYYADIEEKVRTSPPPRPGRKGAEALMDQYKIFDKIFKLGEFDIDRTHFLKRTDRLANPVFLYVNRNDN